MYNMPELRNTEKTRVYVQLAEGDVTYLDKAGQERPLGTITAEAYNTPGKNGGKLQRHLFTPAEENPFGSLSGKKGPHNLGQGSDITFINPAGVQSTIQELGWKVKDQYGTMGGARMTTVYTPAKPVAIPDPISWDHGFWAQVASQDDLVTLRAEGGHRFLQAGEKSLVPAITVETSLMIGFMATKIRAGFMRLLCTNGLMSVFFNLPQVTQQHRTFKREDLARDLGMMGVPEYAALPMGPQVGQVKHLKKALTIFDRFLEERTSETGVSENLGFFSKEFTAFNEANLSPVQMRGYVDQLHWIANNMEEDGSVYIMDLVNAYTNAVNARREITGSDRGVWAAQGRMDNVIKSTNTVIRMANIFS